MPETEVQPISPTEPLSNHIDQSGITYGPKKLALFRRALHLRGVPVGEQQCKSSFDAIAHVKIFDPCGNYVVYITDKDDDTYVNGFVVWHEPEFGPVDLQELSEAKGPLRIGMEIDTNFLPQPLREVLKQSHPNVEIY